ncbi:MAG: methyl-accepting protein [Deltaproteobacteria bacterium]|nr:methyl-accepting protein [Deltaproteobacteria bacterium]
MRTRRRKARHWTRSPDVTMGVPLRGRRGLRPPGLASRPMPAVTPVASAIKPMGVARFSGRGSRGRQSVVNATDVLWLLVGAALGAVATFLTVRPRVAGLLDMAEQLSRGDADVHAPAGLSEGFPRQMARTLEAVAGLLRQARTGRGAGGAEVRTLSQGAEAGADGLLGGLAAQLAVVEDSAAALGQMSESLKRMEAAVETLVRAAEESSSTVVQIGATNNEVVDNIHHLATAVEETAASIEEMTYSIKEVAKNIEDLSLAAEQTSASMNEMDTSISQVESNANATARLSEEVSRDAEKGSDAVVRTIEGIDRIRDSTRAVGTVIKSLGNRIQEIGNILNVIDDVAEQTNLLALNAAIIAAQSGEHGRGFAVVADEIKDLAERTAASTKEIATLIKSVQDESRNAVESMQEGERNVEAGVGLSREADGALRKILDSAQKSTQMVKAIAQATVEQAKGSKVVADAVERIAKTVQQVAAATAEQARGSEQIMKSAERMKGITQHVERSTQEQSKGSKQVSKSIESIHETVGQIHKAHREQQTASEHTLGAARRLRDGIQNVTRSAEQLKGQVHALRERLDEGEARG